MKLPSFDEFLTQYGQKALSQSIESRLKGIDGKYILTDKDSFSQMIAKIVSSTAFISVDMLAAYHEWLSEQAEQLPLL